MTISQMRYFVAVCRHKSITRAAEALHIAQPSISSSIKELEKEFEVALFYRVKNHLSLTKEGEIYLEKATEILRDVDDLSRHMKDMGNKRNLIRFGVSPMIGTFLFPDMFHKFREIHPEIDMEIIEYSSLEIRKLVAKDALDIAIVIVDAEVKEKFNLQNILSTRFLFCVDNKHPMAGLNEVDINMIKDIPLILFLADSFQCNLINTMFEKNGLVPNVLLHSSQLSIIEKFLSDARTGTFLFEEIIRENRNLVGIPIKNMTDVDIALVWRKGKIMYSDAVEFINFTKLYRYD